MSDGHFEHENIEIFQADCLDVLPELQGRGIRLAIADPPYNVYDIAQFAHAVPFQRRNHAVTFDEHDDNFLEFTQRWVDLVTAALHPDGSLFVFGGVNYKNGNDLLGILPYLRQQLEFINLIVWHYPNGSDSRRFFANRHELIAWFARSRKYTFNLDAVREIYDEKRLKAYLKDKRLNPEVVAKGRNPTNVWQINRVGANAKERLGHPTQKPEEIIERIVLSCSDVGDVILDSFAGVGTTPAVCARLGRGCIAIESDPNYFKIAVDRVQHVIDTMGGESNGE
ncbi:MAG TPA: site-specific DNA-methyltransferase [Candidatus Lokiarchaeia archaeon]|nr:site-specific DNA-methyltransferase [Candidatus Lokiarchaeia archaeon]